jgi:DNA-binding MarR family transcriptional regulator
MKSNQDLSGEVLIAIRRVIRAVDLHSKKLSQQYNLTGPQALVLKEISVTKGITPGALAKRVSLSQATITDIVKRLESRDCVRRMRGMDDRRKVVLEITAEGIKLIETAPPLLQEKFTQRFNQLADWEQTLLLSSLQRVAFLMDAESLDAAPLLTSGAP